MKRISSLLSALLALCVLLSSLPAAVSETAEPVAAETAVEVESDAAEAGDEEAEEFELGGEEDDFDAGEVPVE